VSRKHPHTLIGRSRVGERISVMVYTTLPAEVVSSREQF